MDKNKSEQAKEMREQMKNEGYCIRCYKRKAVKGKFHCVECAAYFKKYYEKNQARKMIYQQQRREKLKAAGLCTACGKNPQGKILLCEECQAKAIAQKKNSRKIK